MSPQCRQFVTLINKLRRILSKDPESEEVLIRMKLSNDTLRGQDESIAIEPEVYRGAQSVTEFFTVMAKYWNCYDDHDLLKMVIEETENEDSVPSEDVERLQHFHYHPGCSNELPQNRVPIVAEVHVNRINGQMYDCIKSNIATALNTPRPAMSLHRVYEGSCVIVWHVSKQIAAGIKKIQLLPDDQEMLLKCKVLNLSCDDKCQFTFL